MEYRNLRLISSEEIMRQFKQLESYEEFAQGTIAKDEDGRDVLFRLDKRNFLCLLIDSSRLLGQIEGYILNFGEDYHMGELRDELRENIEENYGILLNYLSRDLSKSK